MFKRNFYAIGPRSQRQAQTNRGVKLLPCVDHALFADNVPIMHFKFEVEWPLLRAFFPVLLGNDAVGLVEMLTRQWMAAERKT